MCHREFGPSRAGRVSGGALGPATAGGHRTERPAEIVAGQWKIVTSSRPNVHCGGIIALGLVAPHVDRFVPARGEKAGGHIDRAGGRGRVSAACDAEVVGLVPL